MSSRSKFLAGITHLDKSYFSPATGLRAAIFLVTPMIVAFATNHLEYAFATFGALFLINTEGTRSTLSLGILLAGCFSESIAWGLGTIAGTTHEFAIPLVAIGVFLSLMIGRNARWAPVGVFTAIVFSVGVGLPGGSDSVALSRFILSLIGGLWALAGVALFRYIVSKKSIASSVERPVQSSDNGEPNDKSLLTNTLPRAIAVGLASAAGLAIGLWLGLPRDYWVVVTIILVVRPGFSSLISVSSMLFGTVLGALIAAAVTLEINNPSLLVILLFAFSLLMFATRGVNLGLMQVFFVPFLIILLNILYPGSWQLAFARILDVVVGGAVAVVTVYLLGIRVDSKFHSLHLSRESEQAT